MIDCIKGHTNSATSECLISQSTIKVYNKDNDDGHLGLQGHSSHSFIHTARISLVAIHNCGIDQIGYSAYSLDLAPVTITYL